MTVITISREIGSGGGAIARQVAKALGYHLVDKQTIEMVLTEYGFAQFREEYDALPGFWSRFDTVRETMIAMLDRIIQAVAHEGNAVILGRGSYAVLGELDDVLNVRIQAPDADRAKRLMETQNIADFSEAEALIAESDELRRAFVQSWYRIRWDATNGFDLVINTNKVPSAMAVRWILETNQAMIEHWVAGAPSARDLPVEMILAETVANALAGPYQG